MAKQKAAVNRVAKNQAVSLKISLAQINIDKKKNYCHRLAGSMKDESLAILSNSLVKEGQQTPFTCTESGEKDKQGRPIYTLVGGFRRYSALQIAIRKALDAANIHKEMMVDAVIVQSGDDQTPKEFARDLLLRSVTENENRQKFTTSEKLRIVADFTAEKIPTPDAAIALSISDTQYARFVSVVEEPWLHTLVDENCIKHTYAAELIDKARAKDFIPALKIELQKWVNIHKEKLEAERKDKAKIGKKLSGSQDQVQKYMTPGLVRHWLRQIEGKQPFEGDPDFLFGINVDAQKGTITVPGRQFKIAELASDDFEEFIGEMQDASHKLAKLLNKQRLLEQASELSDEASDAELQRIKRERRERQRQIDEANRGQPADDFEKVEAPTTRPAIGDDSLEPDAGDLEPDYEPDGDDLEPDYEPDADDLADTDEDGQ